MKVPAEVSAVRWAVLPLGIESWVPGPIDYNVLAYLDISPDSWPVLEGKLGGPQKVGTIFLREELAAVVIPETLLATLPRQYGGRVVTGVEYDLQSLARSPYDLSTGVRIGNALVANMGTR